MLILSLDSYKKDATKIRAIRSDKDAFVCL